MPPLNLPLMFAGRPVKPVALGLTLSMVTVLAAGITNTGVMGDSAWGDFVSAAAAVAAAGFLGAWIWQSQRMAEVAMAMTCGVFIARASFVFLTLGLGQPAGWLSVGSAVVAGGSFVLEHLDPKRIPPPGHL